MNLIGIVPSCQTHSSTAEYHLYETYVRMVSMAGGTPIILPYEDANAYVSLCNGLLFTGGGFTMDPSLFGQLLQTTLPLSPVRSAFELALFKKAFAAHVPILGICAGAQLINVALGGSLIQHIPTTHPHALLHSVGDSNCAAHPIEVIEGTLLSRIAGNTATFNVNTSHVQAIDRLGEGVILNAKAPDGITEGIEVPSHPFCLGTQWHPERQVCSLDLPLFQAFIEASAQKAMEKAA